MPSRFLVFIVVLGVAFGVTGPKLYKMARVKGWLAGAVGSERTVLGKGRGPNDFWVVIAEGDVGRDGPHRVSVPRERWDGLKEGDRVEVVSVPGDPVSYVWGGIQMSAGNFAFDLTLLAGEMGVAGAMAWQVRRLYRERRERKVRGEAGGDGGAYGWREQIADVVWRVFKLWPKRWRANRALRPLVRALARGADESVLLAARCPCCGAALEFAVTPGGNSAMISCTEVWEVLRRKGEGEPPPGGYDFTHLHPAWGYAAWVRLRAGVEAPAWWGKYCDPSRWDD